MIYLFIFLFLFFLALSESYNNAFSSVPAYIGSYFILLFIAGLRYETGGDWQSYTSLFESLEPLDQVLFGKAETFANHTVEIGFRILISLVKFITDNVQVFLFIISLLSLTILFKAIKRYSPLVQMSVLLYFGVSFFILDMVAIRQCLAVSLFFFSLHYIYIGSFSRYLCCILLATLVHYTAILLLPLFFVLNRYYSNKFVLLFFVLSNAVFILKLRWFLPIITLIFPTLDGALAMKVYNYGQDLSRGFSIGLLMNMILFVLFFVNRKRCSVFPYFNLFFNLFLINCFVYAAFFELIDISNRFRLYFTISEIILLPIVIKSLSIKRNAIIAFGFTVLFSFAASRFVFLESLGGIAYNPYQNYLIYRCFNLKSTGEKRLEISDQHYIDNKSK